MLVNLGDNALLTKPIGKKKKIEENDIFYQPDMSTFNISSNFTFYVPVIVDELFSIILQMGLFRSLHHYYYYYEALIKI